MEAKRKLAALLFADVVGYSRLVGADEAGAVARVRQFRQTVLEPALTKRSGRLVKSMGDGFLAEFGSVVDATRVALELQDQLATSDDANELRLRIGVHIGDVIVEGDDLLGDGVNLAARLQAFAEPGAICLSADAFRQVEGKVPTQFQDAGEHKFKNMERPVRVYTLLSTKAEKLASIALPLPDKPSIAVLPFANMSGNPEQEYFADGMVEDIITALSQFRNLFVIARNSSFVYKGRAVDVKQVGRDLGVRYVLEGSVRRANATVRITCQLIDASTGNQLWAEKFDGSLDDVFELQDRVSGSVGAAIGVRVEQAEIDRSRNKPTANLDAYERTLRAISHLRANNKQGSDEALRLCREAIRLDPNYALPYAFAAMCMARRKANGWMDDPNIESQEAKGFAEKGVRLGGDDALALCWSGQAIAFVVRDLERGEALLNRAVTVNPNLAIAWMFKALVGVFLGRPDTALKDLEKHMRLSPVDPDMYIAHFVKSAAQFFAGQYVDSLSWARKSLGENPNYAPALRYASASCVMVGMLDDARVYMGRLREVDPKLRLSNLSNLVGLKRQSDLALFAEALRKAGLPE